ncbi:MAG TPA: PocR ligand-binding domain-containing protein [Symbiobacteriaceae bacterium]|nr:PocR ligand-binding domain-containing protein [Symbiobacteriaceae bacterium]
MEPGVELWGLIHVETLQEIQDRFSEATGLGAIIADSVGRPLTQASCFSDMCKRIRSTVIGLERCFDSDARVGRESLRTGRPATHYCHAGLVDVATPIVVNGTYVGSALCGQVLLEPLDQERRSAMARNLVALGIDPAEADTLLDKINIMSPERFKASAELLRILANYIVNQVVSYQTQRRLAEESRARVELEKNLKEMELRVLQSQVNPHFLFNALNTVARMALFEEAAATQDLVYRLTRILRFNLSRIDKLIPLRDELSHVENYLHIQQVRFGERVRFRFSVDAEVLGVLIPILTVQPLVENAVVRGLEPLPEGGEVAVRAWSEAETAVIEVTDDGTGIDEAQLSHLLSTAVPSGGGGHTTGLGIPNVHQRLQHYFGSKYGLTFLKAPRGTCVQIRVPMGGAAGGV